MDNTVSSTLGKEERRGGRTKEKIYRPCAVCGDVASGFHYKAPTCEGCKGFFRRTIQKNQEASYSCDNGQQCIVDKSTRTQCQKCRFDKCLAVGMTPHTVLSERQRVVKRQIREENRVHRQFERPDDKPFVSNLLPPPPESSISILGTDDNITQAIGRAYSDIFTRNGPSMKATAKREEEIQDHDPLSTHLSDMLTPSVSKIIEFAKLIPGFSSLQPSDQICLLQGSCMEILCLRAALRYDVKQQGFPLRGQRLLTRNDMLTYSELHILIPLFNYAQRIQELDLDITEASLLASILSLQSSRSGLREPERVELYQDAIMNVSLRYARGRKPEDELRWMKTLSRIPPLRGLSTRKAEKAVYIDIDAVDHSGSLSRVFLHLFEEDV